MEEISLYELLKFYAKNWLVILCLTVVGLLIGFIYNTYIQRPMYKSNATLLLINSTGKPVIQDATLINNYIELFKSRRVLEPVIKKQNSDITYDSLISLVDATSQKDTEVMKVSIATGSPHTSKALVDGAVVSFKEQVRSLYGDDNVKVVDNADSGLPPYNVHKELQLALATAAGFILSIVILFFVYDYKGNKKSKKKVAKKRVVKKQKTIAKAVVKKPTTKSKPAKKAKNMLVGDADRARQVAKRSTVAAKKPSAKKAPVKMKLVVTKKAPKKTAKKPRKK